MNSRRFIENNSWRIKKFPIILAREIKKSVRHYENYQSTDYFHWFFPESLKILLEPSSIICGRKYSILVFPTFWLNLIRIILKIFEKYLEILKFFSENGKFSWNLNNFAKIPKFSWKLFLRKLTPPLPNCNTSPGLAS